MTNDPRRRDKQVAEGRRLIVAECYKKGMTIRQTCDEVMVRTGMDKPPGTKTVFNDRNILLKEWRKERVTDMDDLITLELARIDAAIFELWGAWEKSKTDHKSKFSKQKGELPTDSKNGDKPKVNYIEQGHKEEINFGDPRYISEVRAQLAERRKLLGLYAPEKKDLTSKGESLNKGFYDFLKVCTDNIDNE